MKIAIAGCGIAGAAVGYLLASQGHAVTIYEQSAQCGPVGAGILIQPIGQAVLKSLGIYEEIHQKSARLNWIEARKHTGKRLIQLEYQRLGSDLYGLGVHRGLLFSSLFSLARQAGALIQENACITGYQVSQSGVSLELESKDSAEVFDFILATDGARSRLRKVSGIKHHGAEYKYGALWTTGACTAVQDRLFQVVEGTQKLAGLLPIGNGECSFFWGLTAAQFKKFQQQGLDVWKKEVLQLCPESEEIVTDIDSFENLTFTTYRTMSMQTWWSDRILFLGDAAHPTSPHLGQGANLALEDVWVFSECLKQAVDFQSACNHYEKLRKKKIRFYQQITGWLTPFFQSEGVVKGWGRDLFLPVMSQTPILREQMLKTLCGFKTGWFSSNFQ
ncbi:FAD-dependent oxidoreductase [Gimesia fumaroli]|uniref:6-hydroxynicotinate 3-monooxygenase n=1 Tax=Gimesia fumaroli TaxID=2527976 RepID=A0A518IDR2_9PLAN|nr:NAD(P)/FAD-dependent oxidoreductase [Gimesia fumaroli]QDV51224.1 6-hydroxynicotinate 3-monooxygenase precursor [Gimesia fumaroli]